MPEWVRVANTTITKHLRQVEENILRNRKLPALAKKKGRITFGNSGKDFDWRIRMKRTPIAGYADADTLTFPRRDKHRVATLDWRGYSMGESMTKKERLMGSGTEGIVKIFGEMLDSLTDDLEDQFAEHWYIDGNAAGNQKFFHGLESFMAAHASNTGDGGRTKDPDDSYAGIDTDPGAFGGTWTGDWPAGTGDSHFDFWSPILIDTDNAVWGASAAFSLFGDDQIRYGLIKTRRSKARKGMTDLVLLDDTLYYQFLSLIDSKERIKVERGSAASPMVQLGFTDAIGFDGADITWEYGITANTGYGLNMDMMELASMQPKLIVGDGPEYVQSTKSYNVSVDIFGNFRFNPRHFFKLST